jgi:ribonuclease R
MILANGAVANLAEEHKLPIIYRNQIASAIAPGQKTMGEALLSLGIPELMRKKLQSWLNPADYEPYVLGHFALALSSYTHFTSPIRRVADYINHRILKAVIIEQIESPYSLEELTNICKRINKYKLDSKIERDDFFAQKNEHKLQNLTAKNTNFNQFSDKEFSEIIKYSLQKEGIKNIQNEVLTRLKNHLLKPLDYYYLTFFDYQEKENTIGVIMEFLANNSNLVTQSLTIASQLKQSDLEFVEQEFFSEGGGYAVWTIFQNATSLKPGKDKNKTIAKHKACYAWLESYLKKELVDFNQREIEQETLEIESINSPEEVDNPIGILNEFLMKNKLKTPKYDFSAKNSEWECVVIVEDKEGKKIMQTYQANSKKVAKQKATLLVLNELGLIALE